MRFVKNRESDHRRLEELQLDIEDLVNKPMEETQVSSSSSS